MRKQLFLLILPIIFISCLTDPNTYDDIASTCDGEIEEVYSNSAEAKAVWIANVYNQGYKELDELLGFLDELGDEIPFESDGSFTLAFDPDTTITGYTDIFLEEDTQFILESASLSGDSAYYSLTYTFNSEELTLYALISIARDNFLILIEPEAEIILSTDSIENKKQWLLNSYCQNYSPSSELYLGKVIGKKE